MQLEHIREELLERPLDDDIRAVALAIVGWLEDLSVDAGQFITVRRVIDRLDVSVDQLHVLAALYVLTQLRHPVLSRGIYWTDRNDEIRVLEDDLYAEAVETGILAHPDYGTEHTDFMEWTEPFFWVNRAAQQPISDMRRA